MSAVLGVLVTYAALVVWAALLVQAFRQRGSFGPFIGFGLIFSIVLNGRYFVQGTTKAIAHFVGIYDVLHNLGANESTAAALAPCLAGDDCSALSDFYENHPTWGVAFYRRFVEAPPTRTTLLMLHIFCNTLTLVLATLQVYRTGHGRTKRQHRALGYVTLISLAMGAGSASLLAAEHADVIDYGGALSTYGFWSMASVVLSCAVMGVISIRRKDFDAHQKWMFRFCGSLWGSFWLFRAMELVLGPLLRNYNILSIQICVWTSAPLGVVLAEAIRVGAVIGVASKKVKKEV
jgi:hypothetical protein